MRQSLLPMILILMSSVSYGQLPDSLQITAGTLGTISKEGYQPLWLVSNRWGAVSDKQFDASTYVGFTGANYFRNQYISRSNSSGNAQSIFYLKYGATLINSNHFTGNTLQEAYLKAGYKDLEFRAGRFKYIPGEVDQDLSSGSMGVSGNALPIPQITIALTDYVSVPYTNDWLQIKGQLSHGWFGKNRYLNSYYHEKNLYLRVGKNKFKFFAGAQHYVEWGGKREGISLDRSFKGFTDVLFATEDGDDGSGFVPNSPTGAYHAGDVRGLVELGFDLEIKNSMLHFYHQSPFDGEWGVKTKNIDNLSGFSITPKAEHSIIRKVLFEFIYTKQAQDYAPDFARQAYYNNGYYKTGWEYQNRIVGTPLFINRTRAQNYSYFQSLGIKPFDWNDPTVPGNANIIYNKIIGGHIGLLLRFSDKLSGKTLVSYTSGQYQDIGPNLNQFYSLQELHYGLSKNLNLSAGIALDAGKFTNNIGGLVGLRWQSNVGALNK
jgi:hypothetical protein